MTRHGKLTTTGAATAFMTGPSPSATIAPSTSHQHRAFSYTYPAIRWLEQNGYDVSYISGIDTARDPTAPLAHDLFISVGHDEYWSGEQRANVEAARAAGVNLAFWGGNDVYWRTRWEWSFDGALLILPMLRPAAPHLPAEPGEPEPADEDVLGWKAAARLAGVHVSTLRREMLAKRFPLPRWISARRIGWPGSEVRAWRDRLDANRHGERDEQTNKPRNRRMR
jgi:predicted DNA-binding transcriptional regulator AlpA